MAKRKAPQKTERVKSTPARTEAQRKAASHQPPTGTTNRWGWATGGLLVVLLLIGAALFFLQDRTGAKPATDLGMVVTPTQLPTPTARPVRPADAPPGIVDYCKRAPKFRDTHGFSTRSVLSTIERGVKGVSMIEVDVNGQVINRYQHPSWDDAGYLGHVILDRFGDVYTFPAPYVSLIDNLPERQNTLYRIDSTTAEMTRFYTLTASAPPTGENPFGLMGLAYDCDTESLYAASVAGSTRTATVGQIVRLDLASRDLRFRYEGVDAFGLGIYITPIAASSAVTDTQPTGKRLYYGLARAPEIYSIGIDEAGDLLDDVKREITLPDPTLKARRLIFARDGTLEVRSRPFDFNLIVTSERPEVVFYYRFDQTTQSWQQVQPMSE